MTLRPVQSLRPLTRGIGAAIAAVLIACAMASAAAIGLAKPVSALEVPPKPVDIPVVDTTNTLTAEQKQALAKRIAEERQATGNQVAVLMIPRLEDNSLEEYSLEVARSWGVGQKDRNSGVLLFIAKDDKRLRIEVGYGLEGALTDIRSGQIIRDRITPKFREGKFYEGINEGLSGILTAIHGEADPNLQQGQPRSEERSRGIPFELIFWGVFIIPIWLSSMLARTKSWWAGGVLGAVAGVIIGLLMGFVFLGIGAIVVLAVVGLLFDRAVSRNFQKHAQNGDNPSWWAGGPWIGGSGGSSGGGFGGFGGGSFGGGGASGDW